MQLLRGYQFSRPTIEKIPMSVSPGKFDKLVPKAQAFLWPREVFSALYDAYPSMFQSSVCWGTARAEQFWRDMTISQHPLLHMHPMKKHSQLEFIVRTIDPSRGR
eukprot:9471086-Pyramimonas_sp.AAC.1